MSRNAAGPSGSGAPPSLARLQAIDQCGRYELLGRIGTGGMAEIFLAREWLDLATPRYLVVKRILDHVADDEVFIRMFLDEARLSTRLEHPYICHVHELGRDGDDYFLAMEWVQGPTLRELQRRCGLGSLPIPVAIRIAANVAGALHYAHRLRDADGNLLDIVHRDVSPHNVMVSYDGVVKLLDFGIAKAGDQSMRTRTGQLKGKFGYMAPEQCMQLGVDARTDVFALGILLWEMLTGRNLFRRDTEIATMRQIIEMKSAPSPRGVNPDVPSSLDQIVRRALAPAARDRFASAGAFQNALEQVLVDLGQVVNETTIADFLEPLFRVDMARGPVLKVRPPRRRGEDSAARSTSGARFVGGAPPRRERRNSASMSHPSGLSDLELAAIARSADAETAAMARGHATKLVLLALALVLVVGAVFAYVGREAILEPRPATESAAPPTPLPPPAADAPARRFAPVVPPD